jgi:hypothetical protein
VNPGAPAGVIGVGYQGRTLDELVAQLVAMDVSRRHLADVLGEYTANYNQHRPPRWANGHRATISRHRFGR